MAARSALQRRGSEKFARLPRPLQQALRLIDHTARGTLDHRVPGLAVSTASGFAGPETQRRSNRVKTSVKPTTTMLHANTDVLTEAVLRNANTTDAVETSTPRPGPLP